MNFTSLFPYQLFTLQMLTIVVLFHVLVFYTTFIVLLSLKILNRKKPKAVPITPKIIPIEIDTNETSNNFLAGRLREIRNMSYAGSRFIPKETKQ